MVDETQEELKDRQRLINCIPDFEILKLNTATTKCRPVYAYSSTNENGILLNQQFFKGPKTQNSIKGLLFNSRVNPIILTGDISRFFYAIHYLQEVEPEGKTIENCSWSMQICMDKSNERTSSC